MGIFSNRVTERTCRKVLSEVGRSRRLLDSYQQKDGDGDPELRFCCVFAGSLESLDAQVLLDPFEEQLDCQRR